MSRTRGSRVGTASGPRTAHKTDTRNPPAPTDSFRMQVTYTETYPDEPPELELEPLEGEVDESELEFMKAGLLESANESVGMVSERANLLT